MFLIRIYSIINGYNYLLIGFRFVYWYNINYEDLYMLYIWFLVFIFILDYNVFYIL